MCLAAAGNPILHFLLWGTLSSESSGLIVAALLNCNWWSFEFCPKETAVNNDEEAGELSRKKNTSIISSLMLLQQMAGQNHRDDKSGFDTNFLIKWHYWTMKVFNLFSSKESFCECRTNAAEKVPFIDLLMCTVFFKHNQKPVLLQYISDMDQAVVIQPFQVSWDSFKSIQNSLRSLGITFELVK